MYSTYGTDVEKSLSDLKNPAKKWLKSISGAINDPFKLFQGTFIFFFSIWWATIKISFFTARKIFDR